MNCSSLLCLPHPRCKPETLYDVLTRDPAASEGESGVLGARAFSGHRRNLSAWQAVLSLWPVGTADCKPGVCAPLPGAQHWGEK